jgi:predicted nuclease of predicted toxin-antitoxin system
MKLLFDQNLSPKLVTRLADLFSDSIHVQSVELDSAAHDQTWEYARLNGFAIVTKDADYNNLSVLRGIPSGPRGMRVFPAYRRRHVGKAKGSLLTS